MMATNSRTRMIIEYDTIPDLIKKLEITLKTLKKND